MHDITSLRFVGVRDEGGNPWATATSGRRATAKPDPDLRKHLGEVGGRR